MSKFSPGTAIFLALIAGFAASASAGAQARSTEIAYAYSPRNDYVVFFDKGTDSLSASAAKTVRMAAREAGSQHIVKIAGSPDRTAAVKAALVRQGVPAAQIEQRRAIAAPLPTAGDAISNPIDRRVEITF